MSDVTFTLVKDEKGRSLTVYIDKDDELKTHVLNESHANFETVLDALLEDDIDVDWLESQIDIIHAVGVRLEGLSERVRVTDTALLFDGDAIDGALTDHIIRLVREGDQARYQPLVAFLEKIQTNPSKDSVDSLYSWLNDRKFSFTPDGDFIAYKGVKVNSDGESLSIHAGRAIVNGVVTQGFIPNPDGAVIEMPRSEVNADTRTGCSTGLHAGTWEYASNFAEGRVLVVKINPRDVVSVPSDCDYQKLRVSRYVVLSTIDQEYAGTTYDDSSYEEDEEYDAWGDGEDEDEYYGY